MTLRSLAAGLCCLALMSVGCQCSHKQQCCGPARSAASPCCPPGTAPAAVIPGPPPGTVGYVPAYYRR